MDNLHLVNILQDIKNESSNPKIISKIDKIINDVKKYPKPIRSIKDVSKIKSIGKRISKLIDIKLKELEKKDTNIDIYENIIQNKRIKYNEEDETNEIFNIKCKFEDVFNQYQYQTIKDVYLIVDNRERTGNCYNYFEKKLKENGVKTMSRQLSVGDFLWIGITDEGMEVELNNIIERKTINDLISSITTNRYKEQKWRLSNSGIENIHYLLEGNISYWASSIKDRKNITQQTIISAIISTYSLNNFNVSVEDNISDTIKKICVMNEIIRENWIGKKIILSTMDIVAFVRNKKNNLDKFNKYNHYEFINKNDVLMTYEQFQEYNKKKKQLPYEDIFKLQLLYCRGCSEETSHLISKKYKYPYYLAREYFKINNDEDGAKLLSFLKRKNGRSIGINTSSNIYNIFWKGKNN